MILLPAKTRYEQDDGGTETITERRIVFSPEIPRQVGEARAEWKILRELAAAVYPKRAQLLGCETGWEDARGNRPRGAVLRWLSETEPDRGRVPVWRAAFVRGLEISHAGWQGAFSRRPAAGLATGEGRIQSQHAARANNSTR